MIALLLGFFLVPGHSHNDYTRPHPVTDAIEAGFASLEVDVFLKDGKLLVGHNQKDLDDYKTLQSMYIEPLRKLVSKNNGHVYPTSDRLILLIDVKTDGAETFRALKLVLQQNWSWLKNSIQPVISGNRDRTAIYQSGVAGYDGRGEDLFSPASPVQMPLISNDWSDFVHWNGLGTIPPDVFNELRKFIDRAHSSKRKVRFWGAPDTPDAWQAQLDAGVDLINTDRPAQFAKWYRDRKIK